MTKKDILGKLESSVVFINIKTYIESSPGPTIRKPFTLREDIIEAGTLKQPPEEDSFVCFDMVSKEMVTIQVSDVEQISVSYKDDSEKNKAHAELYISKVDKIFSTTIDVIDVSSEFEEILRGLYFVPSIDYQTWMFYVIMKGKINLTNIDQNKITPEQLKVVRDVWRSYIMRAKLNAINTLQDELKSDNIDEDSREEIEIVIEMIRNIDEDVDINLKERYETGLEGGDMYPALEGYVDMLAVEDIIDYWPPLLYPKPFELTPEERAIPGFCR